MATNTQVALIAAGIAACVLALLWRALARHHETARLNRRLCRADEPVERARAGNELVGLGLTRSALLVIRAMALEPDARVRLSVALAVARRQWEPTGARRVRSVRKWASEELELQHQPVSVFGPAVTRLADMGGPRPPASPDEHGPAPVPSPAATPAEPTPPPAPGPAAAPTVPPAEEGAIRWVAPSRPETSGR